MSLDITLTSGETFYFDIQSSNPFLVFPWLQKVAAESVGQDKMLDLSRGDPGYGFSPNERSRRFFSLLVFLDSHLNNRETKIVERGRQDTAKILEEIQQLIDRHFEPDTAKTFKKDWEEYLAVFKTVAASQGLPASDWDILLHTFGYSNVTGGNYHNAWGEPHTRAVLAKWHSEILGEKISYQDLMVTHGASHAIGAIYEALGPQSIGYLKPGSGVVLCSPAYYPYVKLNESYGLNTVMIRTDPFTGAMNPDDLNEASRKDVKMLVLIDPHNPTGFHLSAEMIDDVASLAEKTNALIVTDEVYLSFLPGKKSIAVHPKARKRTIRIDSLSKIQRSTGLRFGDMMVLPEAEEYISKSILKGFLKPGDGLKNLLFRAKSPGGGDIGAFQHTTTMPGPCQFLGISHILLGDEERDYFSSELKANMKVFHESLGIPYHGNMYYSLIDLIALPGWKRSQKTPEDVFVELARQGVVLIPANLFFFAEDRKGVNREFVARVSLGNLSQEKCRKAAEIILEYGRQ